MIMYKRNFDENRKIYFFIEKEKVFMKYLKVLEKVRNIIKNIFNRKLMHSKKYLKDVIRNKHIRRFSMFTCTSNTD